MLSFDQALTAAGQLVFFGFDGCSLNSHARRAIEELHLGNVILFTRNYQNPQQFSALIHQLQQKALKHNGAPLFVAADQEGGSVMRTIGGATWYPGPMATRAAGRGPALAQEVGSGIGAEMARMGLNFALAPLADLADNPDSAHIGSRSYGADPTACAPYLEAFVQGMQRHVIATAKHFPSIGGSRVDLHLELGRNLQSAEHLKQVEMAPVRAAVRAGVAAVMTSHEVYPALEDFPGTLSPVILQQYLRQECGFQGLIVSDCMEMKALCQRVPAPEACVRAVQAGVDLLLICHTENVQAACVQELARAIQDGRISQSRLDQSLARIQSAKQALNCAPCDPHPETDPVFIRGRALTEDVCKRALTADGDASVFRCRPDQRFLLIAPPPAALTMADEAQRSHDLCSAVAQAFPAAECVGFSFPLCPEELESIRVLLRSGHYEKVLFATYNLHTDPGQQALADAVFSSGLPVGAIALRTPYDARWFGPAQGSLFCYEYTPAMIAAVLALMRGEISCTGRLPEDVASILERERERFHVQKNDGLH